MLSTRGWLNTFRIAFSYYLLINCLAEAEFIFTNDESDKEILDKLLIKSGYDKRTRPEQRNNSWRDSHSVKKAGAKHLDYFFLVSTSLVWTGGCGSPVVKNHRRLRRQWCDERRMWAAKWNEVFFTDESRICLLHHDDWIQVWRHRGERMLNSCVIHRHTGPAPGIMFFGGIGYHSGTPLVRIAGTLNCQRYISELLEPVVFPYLQGWATAIFQQDNARPHVACIVQRFFVNQQIELLPWPARSPDLSPIENMWAMVAQRLTQITSPAATPDQLWQRVEAAWSAVPQEHIQSLFESIPRRLAAVISNNGG
ncbi:transposable element Tcb1 transposase [Trichonephila clavipes]|nr:transposable element Tcb1 transposase [Trichonephila clavipes]